MNESAVVERSLPARLSTPAVRMSAATAVIAHITDGLALKRACEIVGISLEQFHYALSSQRELSQAYARAQEIRADVLVDEAIAAADSDEDPAKARNKMTVRQWAASKFNSKRYGDRIDLNVTQTLDISSTLLEARQRALRPISDQQDISDAQVIDSQGYPALGAADSQSEADIFGGADQVPAPAAQSGGDEVDIFS